MYRNKQDVDRHVQEIFRKTKNEDERICRYYSFAKLYYQVGDYESAKRYVSIYLEKRQEMPAAHKLLGNILEVLGQKETALEEYKTSLVLDPKQDDLILKVCEILSEEDISTNIARAQYWVERAEKHFPHHPAVFRLKEKLLTTDKTLNGNEDLESLIKSELEVRPSNIQLRVKLLKHYLSKNSLDEAYSYAFKIETSNASRNSVAWYQVLNEVASRCKVNKQSDYSFWIFYVSIAERYAALCIKEQGNVVSKNVHEVTQAVINFDQVLNEVTNVKLPSNPAFLEHMVEHMRGQLHFHLGCLIIKKTKRGNWLNWSESGLLCSPLFLTALQTSVIDPAAPWAANLKDTSKNLVQIWNKEGAYRCSQSGHILLDYAKDNEKRLLSKIESFCTKGWRKRIYKRIFSEIQYQQVEKSYFAQHNVPDLRYRLHTRSELKNYDEIAESVWPASLHHQVWLGVCGRNLSPRVSKDGQLQPHQYSHIFPELQLTVFNLNQAAPETLSRLDVDAFLNAATLCASASLETQNYSMIMSPERFPTLPADLTSSLVTVTQERWWECAYKVYHKKDSPNSSVFLDDDVGEVRQELQRGLEVIRCIGSHGLNPVLLVHLARIFQFRAKKLAEEKSDHSDVAALQARSELYWSVAIPLLERLLNDQVIRTMPTKLFSYEGKDMTNAELTRALEEARLVLVQRYIREGNNERAIDALKPLKSPEASFNQGKIYKRLADEVRDTATEESKNQRHTLYLKARNAFYVTLDRLRNPDADPKHPLNTEIYNFISEIDDQLKMINPDLWNHDTNRYEGDLVGTDESYSSACSNEDNRAFADTSMFTNINSSLLNMTHTPKRLYRPKVASTPSRHEFSVREEARPSPEKLDIQMRQLMAREAAIETVVEQNKMLLEQNKILIESHKMNTEKLADVVRELANLKLELNKKTSSTRREDTLTEDELNYELFAQAEQSAAPAVNPAKAAAFAALPGGYKYLPVAPPPPPTLPLHPAMPYLGYGGATAAAPGMFLPPRGYSFNPYELYSISDELYKNAQMAPQATPFAYPQELTDTQPKVPPVNPVADMTSMASFGYSLAQTRLPSAPHNYQISMPVQANIPTTVNLPPFSKNGVTNVLSSLSNSTSEKEKKNTSLNTSDLYPEQEHDPIPDFKPLIPLPAEVAVTTGEEDETTLFCARAKLFRFVDKEWKERGIGNVKILKNNEGKVRLLMRREQVLKICANHFLRRDMELSPMPNNDKAWFWAANDFADEQVKLEKFCIRFKTAAEAQEFKTAFDNARLSLPESPQKPIQTKEIIKESKEIIKESNDKFAESKENKEGKLAPIKFGGFSFSSTPVIQEKPKEDKKEEKKAEEPAKPSTFAGWNFKQIEPKMPAAPTKTFGSPVAPIYSDKLKTETKITDEEKATLKSYSGANFDIGKELASGRTVALKENKSGAIRFLVKNDDKVLCSLPILKNVVISQEAKVLFCLFKEVGKIKSKNSLEFESEGKAKEFYKHLVNSGVAHEEKPKPLSQLFKPAAGSWECTSCYTRNNAGTAKCLACQGPAPSTEKAAEKSAAPAASDKIKPLSELFKPAAGSWECTGCYTRNNAGTTKCLACQGPAPGAPAESTKPEIKGIDLSTTKTFSFGLPADKTAKSGFNFQMPKLGTTLEKPATGGFKFGAQPAVTKEVTPQKEQYSYTSPGKPFNFSLNKSPAKPDQAEIEEVEQAEDVYFTPVIPLPDKIEVKTGEENETVLYSHRAKLFRYDNNTKEWKERGLGDIKLLEHKESGKLRLLMRRDQIFKLCLNHFVTSDLQISSKDDKSWLWSAADYSDGEIEYHQFACRFKNPEIAGQFKKAIDDAILKLDKQQPAKTAQQDIQILYEVKVTEEEKDEAKRLQLPENFYAYKQKEDCPGCIGCQEPEYSLAKTNEIEDTLKEKESQSKEQENKVKEKENKAKETKEPENKLKELENKAKEPELQKLIFGSSKPMTQLFEKSSSQPTFGASPFVLSKPSTDKPTEFVFGQAAKSPNIFAPKTTAAPDTTSLDKLKICSPESTTSSTTMTTNAEPLFGKPNSMFGFSNTATPTFGAKSIFDGVPKGGVSVFGGNTQAKSDQAATFSFAASSTGLFGSTGVFGGQIAAPLAAEQTQDKTEVSSTVTSTESGFPSKPLFGSGGTGIFANATIGGSTMFGGQTKPQEKVEQTTPNFLLESKDAVTFSALAAQVEQKNAFKIDPNFAFEGAGSTIFGSKSAANKSVNKSVQKVDQNESVNADEEEEVDNDAEHDPHFEPIVPLPDKIEVRTGEEDETKVFCERAKLYRYDGNTKEWKERGVGEMKVLHHTGRGTYRLLLRREQVYKTVCNLLLTQDTEFLPLQNSDRAWMWAGMNYAEEPYQIEKLAIRFKSPDMAIQFKQVIDKAQESLREKLNSSQAAENSVEISYEAFEYDGQDIQQRNEDSYQENCEDKEEDEDDEHTLLLEKKATLDVLVDNTWTFFAMGDLQIIYDSNFYGARIALKVDETGEIISNTLICVETNMQVTNNECIWSAKDYALSPPMKRTFKATLESNLDADEMYQGFCEGQECARQVDICESLEYIPS